MGLKQKVGCRFFFSCTPGLIFWTTFRDTPCESELIYLVTQVRAMICCLLIVHNPVWELHTSAAMPPSLLFSVASTTIVETYHEPMNQVYIFNLWVTGRLCILLFLFFWRFRCIPRFFPPSVSILARARSYSVFSFFFFSFELWFFCLPFAFFLRFSFSLFASLPPSFSFFFLTFRLYVACFVLSCFAILSFSVFRLQAKWTRKCVTYLHKKSRSPRRPATSIS